MIEQTKDRQTYIDVLAAVAAFCVVAMHGNLWGFTYTETVGWYQSLAVLVLGYWAVPIFFMNSGAKLMNYRDRYTSKEFLIRRFSRTLIPYLFWILLAMILKMYLSGKSLSDLSLDLLYRTIVLAEPMDPYWFFFGLWGIYLLIPILSIIKGNRTLLWYLFWVGFVSTSLYAFTFARLGIPVNDRMTVPLSYGGFTLFAILGYLLSTQDFKKRTRITLYVAGSLSFVTQYFIVMRLSIADQYVNPDYFSYMNPLFFLQGASIFVFAKNVKWKELRSWKWFEPVVKTVAACSYGIYLLHQFLLGYIFPAFGWGGEKVSFRTLGVIITFGVTLSITWIARRTPGFRLLLP
jgi:surface polysaccharide O-acyltransferase-like enzyme